MENYEGKVVIESVEEKNEYIVTIHDNKNTKELFYEENETINKFNYEKNILIRENERMRLEYNFLLNKKSTNSIFIKDINNTIDIEIFTEKIEKNENFIEIIYLIENNKFKYRIEKVN